MDDIDKEVLKLIEKDPIKVLKHDKVYINNLKKENESFKKQIELLMKNNKTLVELIEILEEKIKKIKKKKKKGYVYNYEKGGWREKDSLDKENIELNKSDLDIGRINLQLAEVIHLMKVHKERNIREE